MSLNPHIANKFNDNRIPSWYDREMESLEQSLIQDKITHKEFKKKTKELIHRLDEYLNER